MTTVQPVAPAAGLDGRIARLRALLAGLDRAVVCFSGGVDSGYLLAEAARVLGDRATALTAVSPSLAPEERDGAERLARRIGVRHVLVETHELDDARYASNPANRCYFCKHEVYSVAVAEAARLVAPHVLDGFNADDRGDHRPGRRAAREQGVRSPLDETGFGKADVREAARRLGLPVWDKPALACLSSRFPYGTRITPDRLARVAAGERVLRELGFRVCRVRFYGAAARIEVEPHEIPRLRSPDVRAAVVRRFRDAGFTRVTVDPQGYRRGSLNEGRSAGGGASPGDAGGAALSGGAGDVALEVPGIGGAGDELLAAPGGGAGDELLAAPGGALGTDGAGDVALAATGGGAGDELLAATGGSTSR